MESRACGRPGLITVTWPDARSHRWPTHTLIRCRTGNIQPPRAHRSIKTITPSSTRSHGANQTISTWFPKNPRRFTISSNEFFCQNNLLTRVSQRDKIFSVWSRRIPEKCRTNAKRSIQCGDFQIPIVAGTSLMIPVRRPEKWDGAPSAGQFWHRVLCFTDRLLTSLSSRAARNHPEPGERVIGLTISLNERKRRAPPQDSR